jgi:DNA-binding transcriptional ArsR family regulator
MVEKSIISALSALSQPTRLRVVRKLSDVSPAGLTVGDLAKLAEVPHNTMSAHLAILSRAGLVAANRIGRAVEYRLNPTTLDDLSTFMTDIAATGKRHSR